MDGEKKRVRYIDIYRGIGIIIMVLGHMKFMYDDGGIGNRVYDIFDHIIHSFHMPMFFFLSGYCYKRSMLPVLEQIRNKARTLLIPYFFYGIFQFFLWKMLEGDSFEPLVHLFWVNTEGLAIAGALWFLTALFVVNVMYIIIDKYIEKCSIQAILISMIAVLGCFLPRIMENRLPYAIDAAFVGLGFFFLGKEFNQHLYISVRERILNPNVFLLVVCSALNLLLTMNNTTINMRTGKYGNVFIFWIISTAAIIIGISISHLVSDIAKKNEHLNRIAELIVQIGQNGIIYVCINQLVITILNRILLRFIYRDTLYNILIVIMTFTILHIAVFVINRSWIRVTLGKKLHN